MTKGTVHAGMEDIRTCKSQRANFATFDVGHLKTKDELPFSGSKSIYLRGIVE